MLRLGIYQGRFVLCLIVLLLYLAACASTDTHMLGELTPSPTITIPLRPSATPQLSTTAPTATAQPAPSLLSPTPLFPTMTPFGDTASQAQVHTLALKGKIAFSMVMDDTYIFWTSLQEPLHLFATSLASAQTEVIATSRYTDRDTIMQQPVRTGDWLVFVDTHLNNTSWQIRAINLKTRTEQTVAEEPGDPASWPGPSMDADGDWVVWTRTGHNKSKNCDETILAVYNLKSGEKRELERLCAEHEHLWAFPHISGHHIVVEQDLPDEKGKGNDIYLFDLITGQRTALTTNHESSMPTIAGPWVVWKDLPRFRWDEADVLYNLQTNEKRYIYAPPDFANFHVQSGRWLYWHPFRGFHAYDLDTNRMFIIVPEGQDKFVTAGAVHGNIVVWCLDTEPAKAPPHDTVLQWRTLP